MKKATASILVGLVLLPTLAMIGCSNSEDGPMLSDEEKIKKMHDGRAAYDQAMKGGKPPTGPTDTQTK